MTERSPWVEMEADAGVRRRRERWRSVRFFAVQFVCYVVLSRGLAWTLGWIPQEYRDTFGPWILIPALLALFVWFAVRCVRRSKTDPISGATSERKLGLPYHVALGESPAACDWWTLVIGDQAIDVDPMGVRGAWKLDRPYVIPFGDIVFVRARASWIDLVCERDGRRTTFEVRNVAYADRQRMLWELAVRVPEAVERGIGGATPTATSTPVPTSSPAVKASSPDAAPRAADAGPALPGMDAAMTGLGSSLVAAAPRNPPPPKSSLGCGLFAGTPRDEE